MKIGVKYISMCEQAKEIQDKWNPCVGDYIWLGTKYLKIDEACRIVPTNFQLFNARNHIWIPMQHQLQDMILKALDYKSTCKLENMFHRYLVWLDKWGFTSMEQLWLAFVMWIKYDKAWDHKNNIWSRWHS